jgi:DNA-directed RNA polymerase subunit RPC12/RpoP
MAPTGSYTEQYECLRCDTIQLESKSNRTKGAIIRCRGCGGATYLVTAKKPPPTPKTKVCKTCGTKLRASNNREQCSACWGVR